MEVISLGVDACGCAEKDAALPASLEDSPVLCQDVVFKANKILLALLAEYFPEDGTAVPQNDAERIQCLQILRQELGITYQEAYGINAGKKPSHWRDEVDPPVASNDGYFNRATANLTSSVNFAWMQMILKVHQTLQQLLRLQPHKSTSRKTNGHETLSLMSAAYQAAPLSDSTMSPRPTRFRSGGTSNAIPTSQEAARAMRCNHDGASAATTTTATGGNIGRGGLTDGMCGPYLAPEERVNILELMELSQSFDHAQSRAHRVVDSSLYPLIESLKKSAFDIFRDCGDVVVVLRKNLWFDDQPSVPPIEYHLNSVLPSQVMKPIPSEPSTEAVETGDAADNSAVDEDGRVVSANEQRCTETESAHDNTTITSTWSGPTVKNGDRGSQVSKMLFLLMDEGHVSMAVSSSGRFDAYLLASVSECLLDLVPREVVKLPNFLVGDERMIKSRAHHARRVYQDATRTFLVTSAKYDWYVTLLTSGSLRAVQDTFVDFAKETWHAQFNRGFDRQSEERLEDLMISLLGHQHDMVRSQSSVCLNNLIDRHDWQQEVPFLPIVRQVGTDYNITVKVTTTHTHQTPDDIFLISMAPSPYSNRYVYTYHTLEWTAADAKMSFRAAQALTSASKSRHVDDLSTPSSSIPTTRHWKGVCNLGKFTRAGFYDWRLVRADRAAGSWTAVQATLESVQRQFTGSFSFANMSSDNDLEFRSRNLWPELGRLMEAKEATGHSDYKTLPVQGRFIVIPNETRHMNLHEIYVDLCGAKFRKVADACDILEERGTFSKVSEQLDNLKQHGIDALCLTGCQARNNGGVSYGANGEIEFDDEDASPYAITCRASVCEVIGGRSTLEKLIKECWRRDLKIFVEFLSRVSVCGAHRKYNNLNLHSVDPQGHPKLVEGGQGKYFNINESSELNYRCKKTWDLYVEDVLAWVAKCDGIRLDCAHLLPRIYEADDHELNRLDPDGQNHYTPLERLYAAFIIPTNRDRGFWTSTAAASHWPNPFLVKVCKEAWRVNPKCVILGDCGLISDGQERRLGTLSRSGLIPYVQSMPEVLLTILGEDASSKVKEGAATPTPAAESITRWHEKLHESLPEGGLMVQSSTTPQSPFPALLYKRGAWPAADLLLLSTDIPCTAMGEDEGRCLRRGVANVTTNEFARVATLPGGSVFDREESSAAFTRARSMARFEDPKNVDFLEKKFIEEFSPATGQDIRQISAHYKHRREFRRRYPILCDAPMMPVKCLSGEKELDTVFATVRIDQDNNVAILGTNFSDQHYEDCEVHISFLGKLISSRHPPSGAIVECWDLFSVAEGTFEPSRCLWKKLRHQASHGGADPNVLESGSISLMTLPELLSYPHTFTIPPYQSAGLGMKVLKPCNLNDDEILESLYLSALRRLILLAERARACDADLADGQNSGSRGTSVRDEKVMRLKVAVQSNYICQSIATATRSSESANKLAITLARIARAAKWYQEITGATQAPCIARLLCDVGVLKIDSPQTVNFFAKVNRIYEGIEPKPSDSATFSKDDVSELCLSELKNLCGNLRALERVHPLVFVTSELGKWSTVGGLGVMIDELSTTLAVELGHECIVMCPYYHVNRRGETDYMRSDGIEWKMNVNVKIGNEIVTFGIHEGQVKKGVRLIFLHNEAIFHHPYPDFTAAVDSVRLLVAFGKAFLEALCQLHIIPEVIVTNDWATGLIPAYGKKPNFFGEIFSTTTFFHIIHNFDAAYEGRIYPPAHQNFSWLHELPNEDLIDPFWSTKIINPSRCVLLNADQWGTVSPSYRNELINNNQSPLSYLLKNVRFWKTANTGTKADTTSSGITVGGSVPSGPFAVCNGVNIRARMEKIAALGQYSNHNDAKGLLQKKYFGFEKCDLAIPLFSFIGRVTAQKGVHLILEAAESIIERYNNRIQILVGGPVNWKDSYSKRCGEMMLHLKAKYPWSFYASPNEFFTDGTLVNVGSDFGLMPSMFEPGGIVQHEFFVAGTPVIAFQTGGLKDTVREFDYESSGGAQIGSSPLINLNTTSSNTGVMPVSSLGNGFTFTTYNLGDFVFAFERAMRVFSDRQKYLQLRAKALRSVFTSQESAQEWMKEFYTLRGKVPINPKALQQAVSTLPKFNVNVLREASITTHSNTPNVGLGNDAIGFGVTSPPASESSLLTDKSLAHASEASQAVSTHHQEDTLAASAIVQFRLYHSRTSRSVAVSGTYDQWTTRKPLNWDNALGCFNLDLALQPGTHYFKFIVDGVWLCSDYHKKKLDDKRIENNYITI